MANFKIENITSSMLDLSIIKDIHGMPVSLRPRGNAGAIREITLEASRHEAVERVVVSQWARLTSVGVAPEPASTTVPDSPHMEPEVVPTTTTEPTVAETSTETSSAETSHVESASDPIIEGKSEPTPTTEDRQEPTPVLEEKPPVEASPGNRNQQRRNR